jgi:hypothetical protein
MPIRWTGPLPPDDPIFTGGVSFVFRNDLPPEADDTPEDEVQPPAEEPDAKEESP